MSSRRRSGHRGEVRRERRRVEEQPQVDRAGGDHRDQARSLRRPARRPPRAGTRPRTRWWTGRSTRPRRAQWWPASRPPPARTGSRPTSMGATALAPASSSARAVEVGTGASCRGSARSPPGLAWPYAVPPCCPISAAADLAPAKPLLRGWMHLVCFFLAIPAGVTVVALAHSPEAGSARWCTRSGWSRCSASAASYHRLNWSTARRLLDAEARPRDDLPDDRRQLHAGVPARAAWLGGVDDAGDRVDRRGARVRARLHRRACEQDHAQRALLLPRLGGGGRPIPQMWTHMSGASSC